VRRPVAENESISPPCVPPAAVRGEGGGSAALGEGLAGPQALPPRPGRRGAAAELRAAPGGPAGAQEAEGGGSLGGALQEAPRGHGEQDHAAAATPRPAGWPSTSTTTTYDTQQHSLCYKTTTTTTTTATTTTTTKYKQMLFQVLCRAIDPPQQQHTHTLSLAAVFCCKTTTKTTTKYK